MALASNASTAAVPTAIWVQYSMIGHPPSFLVGKWIARAALRSYRPVYITSRVTAHQIRVATMLATAIDPGVALARFEALGSRYPGGCFMRNAGLPRRRLARVLHMVRTYGSRWARDVAPWTRGAWRSSNAGGASRLTNPSTDAVHYPRNTPPPAAQAAHQRMTPCCSRRPPAPECARTRSIHPLC